MLDIVTRARLSLLVLLVFLLLCCVATYSPEQPARNLNSEVISNVPSDVAEMQQLAELQHRTLTTAELRHVLNCLDQPNWMVTSRALRVLEIHRRPQLAAARLRLLRRAASVMKAGPVAVQSPREWVECLGVMHAIMDGCPTSLSSVGAAESPPEKVTERSVTDPRVRNLTQLWADLARNAQDGHVRARSLAILANESPHDLQQIALAALNDRSEHVCLVALEIVAANRWQAATPGVTQLASSPRPELRRRAIEVQMALGSTREPREYGECVMRAARNLADQFEHLGIDLKGSLGGMNVEELNRNAEAYLDQTADSPTRDRDSLGVFLLAAAARAEQRKLTLRLWENEISNTDSDDEFLEHGLQATARSQLLTSLDALRRGDHAAALESMSAVARLARYARPHSSLHAYAKQADALSSAIQGSANSDDALTSHLRRVSDSVTRVVVQVLDQLDLSQLEQSREAQRRLDKLCGLDFQTPVSVPKGHLQPLAN